MPYPELLVVDLLVILFADDKVVLGLFTYVIVEHEVLKRDLCTCIIVSIEVLETRIACYFTLLYFSIL